MIEFFKSITLNEWKDLALILASIGTITVSWLIGRKTIKSNTEIKYRQEWIDNTRDTMSRFFATLHSILSNLEIISKKTDSMISNLKERLNFDLSESDANEIKKTSYEVFNEAAKSLKEIVDSHIIECDTLYFKLLLLLNANNKVHKYLKFNLYKIHTITSGNILDNVNQSTKQVEELEMKINYISEKMLIREWYKVRKKYCKRKKIEKELKKDLKNFNINEDKYKFTL